MTDEQPACRITYVTWNLVAAGVLGIVALGEIVPILVDDPWSPVLWIISGAISAALVWGVWNHRRRPSWILPRLYLLIGVPIWLTFLVIGDMISFWLNAIWLVILPVILSDDWFDRWLGAPTQLSSTN